MPKRIKVFLSHNSLDKPQVEQFALRLGKESDIEPWLDRWNLIPGAPWQEEIEAAITACDCCVVFIGKGEGEPGFFSPWQHVEMRAFISRQVSERSRKFRVIPDLLPGAERNDRRGLPPFLVANMWVEFKRSIEEQAQWHSLLCGIRGQPPGPPAGSPSIVAECPYRGLEVFDVSHSAFFFGRAVESQWLVTDVRK